MKSGFSMNQMLALRSARVGARVGSFCSFLSEVASVTHSSSVKNRPLGNRIVEK